MKRIVFFALAAAAFLSALPSAKAQDKKEQFTVNNVTFNMVLISSRSFKMGATPEQREEAMPDEFPEHNVHLSEYALGETEVTQALWKAVMGDNPSLFQVRGPAGENLPVESVSYDDCMRFISRLNSLTGKRFRLPPEAEWECAARGGYNTMYAGYSHTGTMWHAENSNMRPHLAQETSWGSPQVWGIYNLSGNVAEWCSDWKGSYTESSQMNPTGPSSGSERICRGGGWGDVAWRCRTSSRSSHAPSYKASDLGFRLAMSMTPTLKYYGNPVVKGEVKERAPQLKSVEVTEKATVLSMSWTGSSQSTCYMNRNAFIKDRKTGKIYTITDLHGITYEPTKTYVGNSTIEFTLVFPPIPVSTTSIDFVESATSNWNLPEIELR